MQINTLLFYIIAPVEWTFSLKLLLSWTKCSIKLLRKCLLSCSEGMCQYLNPNMQRQWGWILKGRRATESKLPKLFTWRLTEKQGHLKNSLAFASLSAVTGGQAERKAGRLLSGIKPVSSQGLWGRFYKWLQMLAYFELFFMWRGDEPEWLSVVKTRLRLRQAMPNHTRRRS